jgi:hypothetical protein
MDDLKTEYLLKKYKRNNWICIAVSFPESEDWEGLGDLQINIKKLTAELLAIACMGGALVILVGLKKKK